jgi:hypothetical protein
MARTQKIPELPAKAQLLVEDLEVLTMNLYVFGNKCGADRVIDWRELCSCII